MLHKWAHEEKHFLLNLEALIKALKLEERVVNGHVGWCAREYDGVHGGHGMGIEMRKVAHASQINFIMIRQKRLKKYV